jgi:phage tail sheath protein FI
VTDGSGRRRSVARFLRTAREPITVVPPSGPAGAPQIQGVNTSNAAFVGIAGPHAPTAAVEVTSLGEYERAFGTADGELRRAVRLFFDNGGKRAFVAGVPGQLSDGLDLVDNVGFSILAIPDAAALDPGHATALLAQAIDLCEQRRAFLVVDPPENFDLGDTLGWTPTLGSARNAAAYFPRLRLADGTETAVSGAVVGIYARTDIERAVWKAPANDPVRSVADVTVSLTEDEVATANAASLNVVRLRQGFRVWGARTLSSDLEWRYVNVRRFALFIERSISGGLRWAAFEPNNETLWTIVRTQVEAFMHTLFQQGAFDATHEEDAYFVRCDRTTMTQDDIDNGRLVVDVGFAPLRPAEFLVVRVG